MLQMIQPLNAESLDFECLGQCKTRNKVERESCSSLLRVWHWP